MNKQVVTIISLVSSVLAVMFLLTVFISGPRFAISPFPFALVGLTLAIIGRKENKALSTISIILSSLTILGIIGMIGVLIYAFSLSGTGGSLLFK